MALKEHVLHAKSSDLDVLKTVLTMLASNEVEGWHAKRSSTGVWTVNSPRRDLRLAPSDTMWDDERARAHLYKLNAAHIPLTINVRGADGYDGDTSIHAKNLSLVPSIDDDIEPTVGDIPAEPKQPAVVKKVAPKAKAASPVVKPVAPVLPANAVRMPDAEVTSFLPEVPASEGEVTYEIDVTPTMARELRARPFEAVMSSGKVLKQRPLMEDNTQTFCELIRAGDFLVTHQGVALGINGSVYDGQHRLEAVVRTGITTRMKVTFNVHPDKIPALDGGKSRTTATKLKMEDYKHANTLGAAAKLLANYLEWETAVSLGDTTLAKAWKHWNGTRYGYHKIESIINEHPDLYEAVCWSVKALRRGKGFTPTSISVFRYLALRAWPEGEDKVDEFLDAVIASIGINSHDHIAKALQNYIERINDAKRKVHYYGEEQLHVLIKCWDLYLKGKTLSLLRSGSLPDEFPVIHRPKAKKA